MTTGRLGGIALAAGAAMGATALCLFGFLGMAPAASGPAAGATVSQRARSFSPSLVTVSKGDVVSVVNDDLPAIHHVYVDADGFKFDSGDQAPGGRADIRFTEAGVFQVLCGIHPRMRMTVRVEERTAEAR